jgi:hypothetical protein
MYVRDGMMVYHFCWHNPLNGGRPHRLRKTGLRRRFRNRDAACRWVPLAAAGDLRAALLDNVDNVRQYQGIAHDACLEAGGIAV